MISEPIQLRTNTPPPKNLHWSCWPQPIPKEKKRPSTSLGFYRSVKEETDKKTDKTSACNAVIENPVSFGLSSSLQFAVPLSLPYSV